MPTLSTSWCPFVQTYGIHYPASSLATQRFKGHIVRTAHLFIYPELPYITGLRIHAISSARSSATCAWLKHDLHAGIWAGAKGTRGRESTLWPRVQLLS